MMGHNKKPVKLLQFILWGTCTIFRINESSRYFTGQVKTLTCRLGLKTSERITKIITIYPLGTMNLCTKIVLQSIQQLLKYVWTKVVD